MHPHFLSALVFAALITAVRAQSLPGTRPLEPDADFSATMVAGIDRFLLRETAASKAKRGEFWRRDFLSAESHEKSVQPNRERLRRMIGAVDPRVPIAGLEFIGGTGGSSLLAETESVAVHRVRWPVLDGITGEGVLIQPKERPLGRVIYIPDADELPEKLAGLANGFVDPILEASGCTIVIPALIDRGTDFAGSERLGIRQNTPHREWIYRQAFEMGRHVIGYEVQKILSLVDWFAAMPNDAPICVAGLGEGGLLAMHAGAIDPRIDSVYVWGYFGPRENLWQEPIYRNVQGLLREFGDAEIASLIAPRPLAVQHLGFPNVKGPPAAKQGQRANAAPGFIAKPGFDAVQAEAERARTLAGRQAGRWLQVYTETQSLNEVVNHLFPKDIAAQILSTQPAEPPANAAPRDFSAENQARQKRLVREMESFTQRLLVTEEARRNAEFWKPLPLKSLPDYEKAAAAHRERFWNDVIGRFPDPDQPMNVRSRLLKETDKVAIHEVTLDVWQDVFAWGWLALPKNMKPGEKRPVVVCQHGLEGIPEDVFNDDPNARAFAAYKGFALRLAEQGFVTFAPHNPYRGKDAFRALQRKLNPLGKSLFSVIFGQHQRILEWLKTQPFVQADKIAFYGLSYGGKSAMRIPAALPGYCLSICSADFNEWVRKCVSTDLPMSYVFTGEYEIWEWNLGGSFNYAEMAALIAPRPFMVERGHDDGVGIDEWVNYEFAKIRRLYNKLGIGDRAEIEHFDGPHTIHGVGTFEFLKKRLK